MSLCLIGFHTYYRCVSGGLPLFWLGRRLPPEFEFKWGLSHSFGLAAASPPSSNFSGGSPTLWPGRRLPPEFEFQWGAPPIFWLGRRLPPTSSNLSGGSLHVTCVHYSL